MCQAWVMTEKKPSPLWAWLLDLKTKEVLVMRCEASWPKYNVSGTKNSHIHIYIPLEAMPLSLQTVQRSSAVQRAILCSRTPRNSVQHHSNQSLMITFWGVFFFTFTGCLVYVWLTQVVWDQNHGPKHTKPQGWYFSSNTESTTKPVVSPLQTWQNVRIHSKEDFGKINETDHQKLLKNTL